METSVLSKITNQNCGDSIPLELAEMRLQFCRDIVKGKCSDNDCPIYRKYYKSGLSCNAVLNQYPDECRRFFEQKNNDCIEED